VPGSEGWTRDACPAQSRWPGPDPRPVPDRRSDLERRHGHGVARSAGRRWRVPAPGGHQATASPPGARGGVRRDVPRRGAARRGHPPPERGVHPRGRNQRVWLLPGDGVHRGCQPGRGAVPLLAACPPHVPGHDAPRAARHAHRAARRARAQGRLRPSARAGASRLHAAEHSARSRWVHQDHRLRHRAGVGAARQHARWGLQGRPSRHRARTWTVAPTCSRWA
jgi:hypothetical protein